MTFSAADAVIKMAESLTVEAMMYASDYWEDAMREDNPYGTYDSYEYEFERHSMGTNWRCRYLRMAIEELWFQQGSWTDDRRNEWLNDEIPF